MPATCGPFNTPPRKRTAADGVAPELSNEENDSGGHEEEAGQVSMLAAMRQPEKSPTAIAKKPNAA